MRVIMFQWRFELPILASKKRSTIRLRARCKEGDKLSLRRWLEKPYRSKQCLISEAVCRSVTRLTIGLSSQGNFWIIRHTPEGPSLMNKSNLQHLAEIEGFDSLDDMQQWFIANHDLKPGLAIEAEQIQW